MNYFMLLLGLVMIFFPFLANYKVGKIRKNIPYLKLLGFIFFLAIMIVVTCAGTKITLKELDLLKEESLMRVLYFLLGLIHLLLGFIDHNEK